MQSMSSTTEPMAAGRPHSVGSDPNLSHFPKELASADKVSESCASDN